MRLPVVGRRSPQTVTFGGAAIAVLLVATSLRALGVAGGWFFADDFAGFARIADGFSEAVSYGEGGHVAPLQNALAYGFGRVFAYQWPAYVALSALGFLVTSGLVLALLTSLWGRRWGVVALFATWCGLAVVTASVAWVSQSLLFYFLVSSSVLVALTVDRALTGRAWWLAAVPVTVALAVVCSERSLVLAPTLALLVVARRAQQGPLPWRRVAAGVVGFVLPAAGFLVVYLQQSDLVDFSADRPLSASETVGLFLRGVGMALTALMGGPWRIDPLATSPVGSAPVGHTLVALALLAVVCALAVVRMGRRALLVWLILLGYVAVSVALVVYGRGGALGVGAMRTIRYYSDISVVGALVIGCCFLTPVPERPRWVWLKDELRRQWLVPATLVGALVVATAASTVSQYVAWSHNRAEPFFDNAMADTHAVPGIVLFDSQLPARVINPELTTNTLARRVLVLYDGAPAFDVPAEQIGMLGPEGHVHPVIIDGGVTGTPGEGSGRCPRSTGRGVGDGAVIELTGDLFDWTWLIRIDYSAATPGTAVAVVGEDRIEFPVKGGDGSVYLPYTGRIDALSLEPSDPSLGLCVASVAIGEPRPDLRRGIEAWDGAATTS